MNERPESECTIAVRSEALFCIASKIGEWCRDAIAIVCEEKGRARGEGRKENRLCTTLIRHGTFLVNTISRALLKEEQSHLRSHHSLLLTGGRYSGSGISQAPVSRREEGYLHSPRSEHTNEIFWQIGDWNTVI